MQTKTAPYSTVSPVRRVDDSERLPAPICWMIWTVMSAALWALILAPFLL